MRTQLLLKDPQVQEVVACHLLHTVVGISVEGAQTLIQQVGGIHKLAQIPEEALKTVPGIGNKRAKKIAALTQWTLLMHEVTLDERVCIRTPADLANIMMLEMSLLEKEELRVVVLDNRNCITCIDTLYQGSVHMAVIRVAEVFRSALLHNGSSIILAHNHPSGSVEPSHDDIRTNKMIVDAGNLLDVEVLDHLIFGCNKFTSLKERCLGFS